MEVICWWVVKPIVWMSTRLAQALRERLSLDATTVESASQFLAAPREACTVSFVDATGLAELNRVADEMGAELTPPGQVIAICDGTLQAAVGLLAGRDWLSHVVSAATLQQPMASAHLANVLATLSSGRRPKLLDWVKSKLNGREVRLTRASKRVEQLERMSALFEANEFSQRTIHQLRDAAEELLTNAFYDAPVAAGASKRPIQRTQDVSLPEDNGCDMVYGTSGELAIVRVRDPFGALSRTRIVDVLTRCARTDMRVEVDETMGGAGLGLWRIFSVASFVAISVVNQHHTDILVAIGKRAGGGQRPFAFHLFFTETSQRRMWKLLDDDTTNHSFVTHDTEPA